MNKILKSGLFLMLCTGMMFGSCKKEYDVPPIPQLPFGDTLTIGQILSMPTDVPFSGASVCGIVTADEQSGNLYKMIFIQDRATGKAIELVLNTSSAARIGDSVRVYLDSTIIASQYHGLPQLTGLQGKGFNPDGHLVIYPYNKPIEPKTVTISDILTGAHVGALVKLENAEFRLKNAAFCETGETTNRIVDDDSYTNTTDDPKYAEFVARTSNYANFAYDYMPVSKGSMVGIASVYNSTWQLIIRSKSEMEFAEWGHPVSPVVPGEVQSLPYTQSFASNFGTYMSYSVIDDDHVWKIESTYSAVVMTGHIQSGDQHFYYANEDWLISSPVAVTGVTEAKMSMNYIGRYFDNINNDVTVWVSSDYAYGTDPTTAQWTQLPSNLVESSSWSDIKTAELSLTEFIGQTLTVAVKYTSTDSKAGTMEVMSITVQEGEAGGGTPTPPGPDPGQGEGSGTADDPYNVAAGISLQSNEPIAWVQGYIVGAVKSGTTSVSGNADIVWSGPFDSATNVVIADDASCMEISQCIIVNLPSGKPLRAQVNLLDNPGNLGKHLAVNGKLRKYFGQAGLRDSNGTEADFVLEGGGTPTPPTIEYFNQSLTSQASFDMFGTYSVAGEQAWSFSSQYGAVMSGYANNTSYANEDWLISPAIDLSASTSPVLVFDHTRGPASSINVGVNEGYYTVWVTNNYTNGEAPNQENWVELTGINHATTAWAWVSSGTLAIPAEFKTANCRIAFRYLSIDGASATWEIKNVVVKEQ